MYYGQFCPPTDKVIEDYFPQKRSGLAIEVGAAQGVAASNTLYFEKLGWVCLCIEPNKNLFSQLKRNRKNVLNYAVSWYNKDDEDFTVFSVGGDETALSSLVPDRRLVEKHSFPKSKTMKVNIRTLDYCLREVNFPWPIDFISIDTEGTEYDVLCGFNIDKYSPQLFVIEENYEDEKIKKYLRIFGYSKVLRHGVNNFYWKG